MSSARLLFLLLVLPALALASPRDPWSHTIKIEPQTIEAGATGRILVTLRQPAGHYVYPDACDLKLVEEGALSLGELKTPKPERHFDKWEDAEVDVWSAKTVLFERAVTIPSTLAPGTSTVVLELKYRGCNEKQCYFPTTHRLEIEVAHGPASGAARSPKRSSPTALAALEPAPTKLPDPPKDLGKAPEKAPEKASQEVGTPVVEAPPSAPLALAATASPKNSGQGFSGKLSALLEGAAGSSFLFFLALMFLGGMLASLTPCVYPMIPVTVALFGAGGKSSKGRSFALSLVYVLGIALTYSVLGVAAARSGDLVGGAMNSPVAMILVSVVFLVLAAGMLGVYNFALPSGLQTRLSAVGGVGPGGALVAGVVGGLVMSPCVGPVAGVALALIAAGSFSLVQGFLAMAAFSLGLGVLFVFIGTFSGSLNRLPNSGMWMEKVKVIFATVMALMAWYFLANVFPTASHWLMVLTLLAGALGAGALDPLAEGAGRADGVVRFVGVVFLALGIAFAVRSLQPASELAGRDSVDPVGIAWQSFSDRGFADATSKGQCVLIDFTADWCVQCKELEHKTFPDPSVVALAQERYTALRVDLSDNDSARSQELRKRFGVSGLPRVAFIGSDGQERKELAVQGFIDPSAFLQRMQQACL